MLKSTDRGEDLEIISPDLTTQDEERIRVSTQTTGGITRDVTGAEAHSTIVALAESPLARGVLYAGTDDGNVWISPNDGEDWVELTGRFPGVPEKTWVSRIEPSHHLADRFYVSFDGHRENDFTPYVYVTDNGGETFRSISNDLPTGAPDFVHVIREDPVNSNLLFVGTDVGIYMSANGGESWQRFMEGMPTVPVHDLKIHPRDGELIAGTHGRSVWIVDITPLQQLTAEMLAEEFVFFQPAPSFQFADRPIGGGSNGHKTFTGESRPYGATLSYYLAEGSEEEAEISIQTPDGSDFRSMEGSADEGMNTTNWNFRGDAPPAEEPSPAQKKANEENLAKLRVIADSMAEEAGLPAQAMNRIFDAVESGDTERITQLAGFGGRGGGGGGFGRNEFQREFVERPGETPPRGAAEGRQGRGGRGGPGARAGRGGGGPGGGGPGAAAGPMRDVMRRLFRTARRQGMGSLLGRGGFGGGGGGPLAEAGIYQVAITVGGVTKTQSLQVDRAPGVIAAEDGAPDPEWEVFLKWLYGED